MDKKNLDKLFQKKLNNFSEIPDERVWQQIEASLNQKKKRRIIPLWWKMGGVAALLILSFLLFKPFEDTTENIPVVVETEKTDGALESSSEKNAVNKSSKKLELENNTQVAENETEKSSKVSNPLKQKITEEKDKINTIVKTDSNIKHDQQKRTENKVVATSSNVEKNTKLQKTNIAQKDDTPENAQNKKVISQGYKEGIAKNDSQSNQAEKVAEKKKSIFDEIAEQENEETEVADANSAKWSVGPSVAPVFFDAMGEGSPIHSIFTSNSKSGNYSMSYGLSVAYEINKRLRVRTGVHKVDYGYDTNDVEFSSSLESSARTQINNINYTANSRNVLVSSNTVGINNFSETDNIQTITTASQNGIMSQQFGYLEVPLELEYSLINSRFGVDIIGGLSSLFLVDNLISLSSQNLTTELGEANNLNSVNFSTNIGLGFNYNFSENIRLNLDPVFKYQLNTFSQSNGTFQPFSVGVYSGISFRF